MKDLCCLLLLCTIFDTNLVLLSFFVYDMFFNDLASRLEKYSMYIRCLSSFRTSAYHGGALLCTGR